MDRLLERLHANPDRCVLVGAYCAGKAQRVIMELRRAGITIRSISTARCSGCAISTRSMA
jgi:Cft2 family RNA processing exonuclease